MSKKSVSSGKCQVLHIYVNFSLRIQMYSLNLRSHAPFNKMHHVPFRVLWWMTVLLHSPPGTSCQGDLLEKSGEIVTMLIILKSRSFSKINDLPFHWTKTPKLWKHGTTSVVWCFWELPVKYACFLTTHITTWFQTLTFSFA